ncbi:hypothetical protein LNAOJCKE_0955 [Methylorubrum aminovorans]|uniref:Uncharacterized protein n=1 Tax=Methylorubrum aminovorans TaxID=269069 RepID=A0ABQ4UBC5_9HYPH|nr:hypothetical protein [Methylorubrum aminovorans]GJE63757.1 hypothetical protein LNAOJCKE_0955 [Methylorubrum aminovorans]GMA73596.1 hypothetical protein GCM10025880_00130 [Methylorubrum aminovorans]GMA73684.1 hypothetical protein GCM10025880_01010 [Methylorubrum aminovorans]
MPAIRQIAWLALQGACVAFWLWVAWQKQQAGEDPAIGVALMLGVASAFIATFAGVLIIEIAQSTARSLRGMKDQSPSTLKPLDRSRSIT